jgi:hypothetical protein
MHSSMFDTSTAPESPGVSQTRQERGKQAQRPPVVTWQLMRIDDHGSEYEMGVFATEDAAKAEMVVFEERGHKQTYFVRRSDRPLKAVQ